MPITRVELSADRLRLRRDNRQLRASKREVRFHDGDTLATASAETRLAPSPAPVPQSDASPTEDSDVGSPSDATGSGLLGVPHDMPSGLQPGVHLDSRLCDLKAVFSGTAAPIEYHPPPTSEGSDELGERPLAASGQGHSEAVVASIAENRNEAGRADPGAPMNFDDAANATINLETLAKRSTTGDRRRTLRGLAQRQLPVLSSGESLDPRVGQSRLDLITGEWTWFATMRSQRPDQFGNVVVKPAPEINCPFCAGEEHRTPDPVWVAKLDDGQSGDHAHFDNYANSGGTESSVDWSVRVVPNLYPAVTRLEDADVQTPSPPQSNEHMTEKEAMPASARQHRAGSSNVAFQNAGTSDHDHRVLRGTPPAGLLFPCEPAMGGHEVIIEAPRHTESFGELNTAEIALVFAAYAARIRYWRSVPGVRHVAIFKNVGRDAGASLQHSHSQLIATNRVPALVQHVTRRLQAHHARVGSCLQCDLMRGEIQQKKRLVSQTDSFVAYCPFASRFPLQVRLTSKEHLPCISELRPAPLNELARLTLRVVRWLEALRPSTAYNVLVHTCPVDFEGATESQHWAMDIFPRVSRLAGFELATGAMINPIYPETAAKAYRAQARACDPRYVLR